MFCVEYTSILINNYCWRGLTDLMPHSPHKTTTFSKNHTTPRAGARLPQLALCCWASPFLVQMLLFSMNSYHFHQNVWFHTIFSMIFSVSGPSMCSKYYYLQWNLHFGTPECVQMLFWPYDSLHFYPSMSSKSNFLQWIFRSMYLKS